jgi:hypothetical protein
MAVNWNQPICERCWFTEHPDRMPLQYVGVREYCEQCCMCGHPTVAGIYIRRHPNDTRFP